MCVLILQLRTPVLVFMSQSSEAHSTFIDVFLFFFLSPYYSNDFMIRKLIVLSIPFLPFVVICVMVLVMPLYLFTLSICFFSIKNRYHRDGGDKGRKGRGGGGGG